MDDGIARFDWSGLRTYQGCAEMVPGALRQLVMAPDDTEAKRLGEWIERLLLSAAGPCEGCAPVVAVLVAALPEMTPAGHRVALDLLAIIGTAEMTGPPHEQIGAVDVNEIRQAAAGGFAHYVAVLRAESSSDFELYSCIDLVEIAAFHDPRRAPAAEAALRAIRTGGRATLVAVAIDSTLDELTDLSP